MRKLVDVSSYNGVVSWEKAKTYGCQGAILKIIRKDLNRDKKFNEIMRLATRTKLPGEYIITLTQLQRQRLKVTWSLSVIFLIKLIKHTLSMACGLYRG